MNPDNLTTDHSKSPKPMNFGTVVAMSVVFLVIALISAFIFLRKDASKVVPHTPDQHRTSYLRLPPSPILA